MLGQALSSAAVPIEVVAAEGSAAANNGLSGGADLLYIDGDLAPVDVAQASRRARRTQAAFQRAPVGHRAQRPAVRGRCAGRQAGGARRGEAACRSLDTRAAAEPGAGGGQFRDHARHCAQASRRHGFPIEVSEADEGFAALKMVREAAVDIVFLDYNMPGFSRLGDDRRVQSRKEARARGVDDLDGGRIASRSGARTRRGVPEETVLPGRYRCCTVPVLWPARAQP